MTRQSPFHRTILVLMLSMFVSGTAVVAGENALVCEPNISGDRDYGTMTLLLVDRSDKIANPETLRTLLVALQNAAKANKKGERLVVEVITGKGTETRILMDMATPTNSIFKSPMKMGKQQRMFSECMGKVEGALLQKEESYKTSPIIETIFYAVRALQQDRAPKKRFIIFSDMIQHTAIMDFYRMEKQPAVEELMKRVEKETLVAALNGAEVFVAGAGGNISDANARKVEAFWRSYFAKSGGKLVAYGPVLTDLR